MKKKATTGGLAPRRIQPAAARMEVVEGVAARIRDMRRSLGLTQDELAVRVGVSRSAIAQWETDRTGQIRSNLARVAAVLGVSVGYLLTGENAGAEMGAETADERALLNLYRQIQDGGRAEVLRQARRILAAQEQAKEASRRKPRARVVKA